MKEILQIDSDTKVIFASADSKVQRLVLGAGAVGFLHKPFKIKELITYVKQIAPQLIENAITE